MNSTLKLVKKEENICLNLVNENTEGFIYFTIIFFKKLFLASKDDSKTKTNSTQKIESMISPNKTLSFSKTLSSVVDESFEIKLESVEQSSLKTFKCSHCPFSCSQIVRLNRHENKHYVKADHQVLKLLFYYFYLYLNKCKFS